jgi:hypothetical protein
VRMYEVVHSWGSRIPWDTRSVSVDSTEKMFNVGVLCAPI